MTDGECAKCKRRLAPASGQTHSMQVDHIVPSHYGGIDHLCNYEPLCQRCNGSKGNRETIDYRPNPREYPVPADAEADRLAQIETFATEKAAAAERRRRAPTPSAALWHSASWTPPRDRWRDRRRERTISRQEGGAGGRTSRSDCSRRAPTSNRPDPLRAGNLQVHRRGLGDGQQLGSEKFTDWSW